MSIQDYAELLALKEVGQIVQLAIAAMANSIRAGISTRELGDIGGKVMRQNGARSAPALVYGFPGDVLISLNNEAVHGIPSESRKVRAGDLVKLDVTFEKKRLHGGCRDNGPGGTCFGGCKAARGLRRTRISKSHAICALQSPRQ